MSKKRNLCIVIIMMISYAILTACSQQQQSYITTGSERQDLVVWSYYETEAQQKALDQMMSDFNHSQNQYTASWVYVPMTEFTKRIAIGMTEEQLPDIVIIDNPDMQTYITLDIFEDITDATTMWEDMDDYYPETLQSCKKDDRLYGIPVCYNNLGLIYNKDLFEKAGLEPPTDWDSIVACVKKLTTTKRYGFAMSALSGEQCAFQIVPWILGQHEENNLTFTEEDQAAAYDKISFLLQQGYMDRNCVNWSQVDIARKFAAGETAIMENGPWVFPMLQEAGVHYGIVPFNVGGKNQVLIGGENFGVIKGRNKEGAVAFLSYYNQDSVMQNFCSQANVLPPKQSLAQEAAQKNPELQVFVKQMNTAIARCSIPDWNKIAQTISDDAYRLFTQ